MYSAGEEHTDELGVSTVEILDPDGDSIGEAFSWCIETILSHLNLGQ